MYLKRLEIIGFKSFADRTEFEFVPGVTAVVGPNGSGKSNVSDAIRWVLGEQSAKTLRGAKMEDIIFSGSDSRKPVNYCEVSLTLDNTDGQLHMDYTEVTVTRRVYRSGESDYFINRNHCRLRDIIELFMDTGVGKEAYSVIGQGRIDEILSTRSEDRRVLFEEAAGIVKYKSRKREAVKKLDETEHNLVRIEDIISEIEEQIGPLGEQAEKAQKYLDLKDQLKEKEIGLFILQFDRLYEQWTQIKKDVQFLTEEQVRRSTQISVLDGELVTLRQKASDVDQKLEQLQQKLLFVTEEAEKKEGLREVLRERMRNYQRNRQEYREKGVALEAKKEQLDSLLETCRNNLGDMTARVESLEQELHFEQRRFANFTIVVAGDVDRLKGDYFEILNQMTSLRNEQRHFRQLIENNQQKIARLEESNSQLIQEKEALSAKRKELAEQLQSLGEKLLSSTKKYAEQEAEEKQWAQRRLKLNQELQGEEQRYNALLSRRDVIREMQADFSGFMQGVREILKAREKGFPGIIGAVAELIRVDKKFEVAIETALGGALQHVVVQDEKAGREAISYLKRNKAGRATFLPLNVIRPRALGPAELERLQQMDGVIDVASNLVEAKEQYRSIIENLLGHVIVTHNLEAANAIARQFQYRYRIVTLEGDLVNPGGSMTGGAIQQKSNHLLGRQRELEKLDQEIAGQKNQLAEMQNKIDRLAMEEQSYRNSLEELRREIEQYRLQEQKIKGLILEVDAGEKGISDRWNIFRHDLELLKKEEEQANHRLTVYDEQLEELAIAEQEKQAEIEAAEKSKLEKETDKDALNVRITELKVQTATAREQLESLIKEEERLSNERHQVQKELETLTHSLLNLDSDAAYSDEEEEKLDATIKSLRQQKENYTREIQEHKSIRQELYRGIDDREMAQKDQRHQLKEVEEKLRTGEVSVGRLDVELDSILNRLREDYELTYERAREIYPLPDNEKETEQQVKALRREIQSLGTVNIGAVEEYERVQERHDFLLNQHNDLCGAKDSLYQVIQDIDAEMSRRFLETFEAIRDHFSVVFSQLFGGGRADLQLTDETNLLETGIEIVAQPPGKKLQYLALLSGGEKALTAIALLFAILKVKPVPFCVLDEVEAALDDANVNRFAEYLREFSKQTQFIVITHRKGTMEGADVLYGITMQESGISRLVSVRLEDEVTMK